MMISASRPITPHGPAFHGVASSSRHVTTQSWASASIARQNIGAHASTYVGHDPGVCAWIQGGLSLWFLGYPDRALANANRSMKLAEQIAHPPTVAHALNHGVILHQLRRDPPTVSAWGEWLVRLAREQRLEMYEAQGTFARGWAMANQDQAKAGLAELRRGMDGCVGLGMRLFQPYHQAVLAEEHLRAGETQMGFDVVE